MFLITSLIAQLPTFNCEATRGCQLNIAAPDAGVKAKLTIVSQSQRLGLIAKTPSPATTGQSFPRA